MLVQSQRNAVLTATSHSYGNRQNSTIPHKIQTLQPIIYKILHNWSVYETNSYPKFGTNRPQGSVWPNT